MNDGNAEESTGTIAALFGESVFHNRGALENDVLEEDDIYVDFDDHMAAEISKELDQTVDEAAKKLAVRKRNGTIEESNRRIY